MQTRGNALHSQASVHLYSLYQTRLTLKTHTVSETENRTSCLTTVSQTITVSSCQSDISNQCRIKTPCITGMAGWGEGGGGGSAGRRGPDMPRVASRARQATEGRTNDSRGDSCMSSCRWTCEGCEALEACKGRGRRPLRRGPARVSEEGGGGGGREGWAHPRAVRLYPMPCLCAARLVGRAEGGTSIRSWPTHRPLPSALGLTAAGTGVGEVVGIASMSSGAAMRFTPHGIPTNRHRLPTGRHRRAYWTLRVFFSSLRHPLGGGRACRVEWVGGRACRVEWVGGRAHPLFFFTMASTL